MLKTNVKGQ